MDAFLLPLRPDDWQDASGRVAPLRADLRMLLERAVALASDCQCDRAGNGQLSDTWIATLAIRGSRHHQYAPRWTFPILYFRPPFAKCLHGARGLDVGANVRRFGSSHGKLAAPPNRQPADFVECHVPHYLYYSEIGCDMDAIDLQPAQTQIERGDARCLDHAGASLDFITAPMLLGPSNVCATPFEIALCLSEFHRVLRPGGFVYFADPALEPSVIYTAQCLDFYAFGSKGLSHGIPLGSVIRKHGCHTTTTQFDPIFEQLQDSTLHFTSAGDEAIFSSDLLTDQRQPSIGQLAG